MKIGVTGTREGATDYQLITIIDYMETLGRGHELHHGDCRGVDVQVATIAKELGWKVVCHPPKDSSQRGYFGGDEMRQEIEYLARDRNIVDETELLMVVPLQNTWQPKGGTWYTHDYAVKRDKLVRIFYPVDEKQGTNI